jgi:cytochrome bd-type quinol oxidase subunit 1
MEMLQKLEEKSSKKLIIGTLIGMTFFAAAFIMISSPTSKLLGGSDYAIRSALHGLAAGVFMVAITIGLFQAFRLWINIPINIREFEVGSIVTAVFCFLTVVSGNWLYIPYRAAGGPRSHFLETVPEVHKIFFEFKEFLALFTLPLIVAACYIICRYGEHLSHNRYLREAVALLLILTFFYFTVAFGLGAAVTKLASV